MHNIIHSSRHQFIKGHWNGMGIFIPTTKAPFERREVGYTEISFFMDPVKDGETAIARSVGVPFPRCEEYVGNKAKNNDKKKNEEGKGEEETFLQIGKSHWIDHHHVFKWKWRKKKYRRYYLHRSNSKINQILKSTKLADIIRYDGHERKGIRFDLILGITTLGYKMQLITRVTQIKYLDINFLSLKVTRMSYASPKHHAKHPRVTWGNTSYEYQVYATTREPMPYQSYGSWEHPNEEQRNLDAPRAQMTDCEYYPQLVKTTEKYRVGEDINGEAEDFIKLEHKKFARLSTSTSMKTD
ncbi:Uncharacterized protein TCM_010553 [Theobroma cacao]|uniref:Uncharacterized protein n=1 Tax=Theobroma cacao TaxID=3641 RepID=A0A061E6Q4_THECC|nr:Uncharacterized protein TCM_010553 [Theobroma cacao]